MRRAAPLPPSRGGPRAAALALAALALAPVAGAPAVAQGGAAPLGAVRVGAVPCAPTLATANAPARPCLAAPVGHPRWRGELTTATVNAAIGGVTAGVWSASRALAGRGSWRDVPRALGAGLLGGTAVYAGKRLGVERFTGAGLLGRQVAGVGASIVRNASAGHPALDALALPVGPVRVYWERDTTALDAAADAAPRPANAGGPESGGAASVGDRASGAGARGDAAGALPAGAHAAVAAAPPRARRRTLRVRVDLATVVGAVQASREPGARFDLARSLSAGAPIFSGAPPGGAPRVGDSRRVGYAMGGAMWLYLPRPGEALPAAGEGPATVRAHEQVHVLQYDALVTQWTMPVERWLLARVPGGGHVARWVDLGLAAALIGLASDRLPYDNRPWEREAFFLSGSSPGP